MLLEMSYTYASRARHVRTRTQLLSLAIAISGTFGFIAEHITESFYASRHTAERTAKKGKEPDQHVVRHHAVALRLRLRHALQQLVQTGLALTPPRFESPASGCRPSSPRWSSRPACRCASCPSNEVDTRNWSLLMQYRLVTSPLCEDLPVSPPPRPYARLFWSLISRIMLCFLKSHARIVLSRAPEKITPPSEDSVSALTSPRWPSIDAISRHTMLLSSYYGGGRETPLRASPAPRDAVFACSTG